MHATLAFTLVTIVAVLTSFLAYVFDWNETHVFNPNWPPHAKFHNAQTLMLGPLSGALSLWQLWHKHDLHSSVLTSSLYWIAQPGPSPSPQRHLSRIHRPQGISRTDAAFAGLDS